jgi:methyl coenzyme M reductase beta subunit
VEMSVKVPGNKIEADVVNNNYEISRNVDKIVSITLSTITSVSIRIIK